MLSKSLLAILAIATSVSAATAPCYEVTTTQGGLNFHVKSNNPLTNGRNIQLRHNPNNGDLPPDTFHYVGLDLVSPVLTANLESGLLVDQDSDRGYLNQRDQTNDTIRLLFGFADPEYYPPASDAGWKLPNLNGDTLFGLYHDEPLGVSNGFLLCEADFNLAEGPWYALHYVTYNLTPADFPECEYVGIQTTIPVEDQIC